MTKKEPQTFPKRISPKDIMAGHIISFERHAGLRKGEEPETTIGLVMDVIEGKIPTSETEREKTGQDFKRGVIGFDVFPLVPHEKHERFKNTKTHYLIYRDDDLETLGLNEKKNFRLGYKGFFVENDGTKLNKDGRGGVYCFANINGSSLFESIVAHAKTDPKNYSRFLAGSAEVNQLRGAPGRIMQQIAEERKAPLGTNIFAAKIRQDEQADKENGEIVEIAAKLTAVPIDAPKRIKKRKNQHGVITKYISLDDAVKAELIHPLIKSTITDHFRKNGTPPHTLRLASQFAEQKPNEFHNVCKRAGFDTEDVKRLIDTGLDFFFNNISNPALQEQYKEQGIIFNYDNDGNPINDNATPT